MLVRLGKLLDGEEKSKKDDIDIGVHDESGALYGETCLIYGEASLSPFLAMKELYTRLELIAYLFCVFFKS